jgi:alkaline phosphatase
MNRILLFAFFFGGMNAVAQPSQYTIANTHSHNDYEQAIPFRMAYAAGFGSIEADIFLQNGELIVGHDRNEIMAHRTLEEYYIRPLLEGLLKNNGHPYADYTRTLQMLIDIKTDSIFTVDTLVALLKKYPQISNNPSVRWVITGNRPDTSRWTSYPSFIWFDGELFRDYNQRSLSRIAMMSDDLKNYTQWNGKSNIPAGELSRLKELVNKSHKVNKPVRFWDAPDFINAWIQLMHLGVDYLNTDHIKALQDFLNQLPARSFKSDTGKNGAGSSYSLYQPTYKRDGIDKPVKNLIILIGDGTGLAQLYAGYTANKKALNIFRMRNVGLSMTSSYDNYVTDSAPGSTAFSSGEKTNNRYIGVDHTGAPLKLLPEILAGKKIKTGLVTCGDIADATPADFYAHQDDRENSVAILKDLKNAPVDILMGSEGENANDVAILNAAGKTNSYGAVLNGLRGTYNVVPSADSVNDMMTGVAANGTVGTNDSNRKWIVVEQRAGLSMLNGRGDWLQQAFMKALHILSRNKAGFFLMTEGAQVDYGGHANNLPYVVTEVMDFDQVVGKALAFADQDGETLVIVTADHETGGLSLLDGDYTKGYVSGQFSTNDHTGMPVPVFAYGPRSGLFRGVYENTEIFSKILQAYGR